MTKNLTTLCKNSNHLQLEDFRLLVWLSDKYRVRDIARFLHVTQPAISQRIAKIRRYYGPFLQKEGRSNSLTPLGRDLAQQSRRVLAIHDEMVELSNQSSLQE